MQSERRSGQDVQSSTHTLLESQRDAQSVQADLFVTQSSENDTSPAKNTTTKRSALRGRISNFQWTWFTSAMSTGGLAIAISQCPKQFDGLQTIGKIFFILELVMFIMFTSIMLLRFFLEPKAFMRSITDPMESFFFGCFWLTQATIIGNIQRYAVQSCGPWLITTLEVLFWVYAAVTMPTTIFIFSNHFRHTKMSLDQVRPSWVLGIYPVMLAGTIASLIAKDQPPSRALAIIIGGIAFQGFGFMMSFMIITLFIYRCLSVGLPPPKLRCGMFIMVGTPGYTATALSGLANAAKTKFPHGFMTVDIPAGEVFLVIATGIAVWLWLLSFISFAWSLVCILSDIKQMEFDVTFWACVFPNIGWVISTALLGKTLESEGIKWVSCAMLVMAVCAWFFIATLHVKAIISGKVPPA